MAELKYQRLTRDRAARRFVAFTITQTRSSLWLGDDHLLFVENTGFTETYKRFFFRDIQVIVFQQTKRGRIWNIILGIFAAISLIIIISMMPALPPANWSRDTIAGSIALGSIWALFVLILLLNFFAGPTCKSFIRTAVQTEEVPALCRVRQTRKLLAKIRPLIVAAQGQLAAEEVSARMQETVTGMTAQPSTPTPMDGAVPPILS
jgi:hypothetical protein